MYHVEYGMGRWLVVDGETGDVVSRQKTKRSAVRHMRRKNTKPKRKKR